MPDEKKIFYICGGRSFFSANVSRKLYEVLKAFGEVAKVEMFCGGDYTGRSPVAATGRTSAKSAARRGLFKDFLINTGSELRDLRNDRKVFKALAARGEKPACVIERSSRFCWAGLRYAKKNRIPYVLEWKDHLLDYRCSLFKWWAAKVEKRKVEQADFILVESEVLKKQLTDGNCPAEKIIVTYNAVNPQEFVRDRRQGVETRRRIGIPEDALVVGYCGSYAFYHDSARMILAAEELARRGLKQVKWLLVGSGRDYEQCRSMAAERGLLDSCVFMIPRVPKEEVPKYLAAFDVAILPGSTDIICPIKVMEYMAAETVVMVPDYECNREVVTPDTGILFAPFSETGIADAIEDLLKCPERIRQLGQAARERVCRHFTWDKTYGQALSRILAEVEAKK